MGRGQFASQAAGEVYQNGKNADKFPPPSIKLKDSSNTQLTKRLDKEFEEEMQLLLMAAGFGGTFIVTVCRRAKGSAHTKGLNIKSPSNHGVVITWHKGSNDNNIEMVLGLPRGIGAASFHQKLKAAERLLCEQEDFEDGLRDRIHGKDHTHEDSNSKDESSVVELPAAETGKVTETAAPKEEQTTKRGPRGDTELRLFFDEIVENCRSSHNGIIPRDSCLAILRREFNWESAYSTGPAIKRLVARGHLEIVSKTCYKMGSRWLRMYADKLPPAPASLEPEQVEVSEPVPVQTSAEVPTQKPVASGAGKEQANVQAGFDQLKKRAGIAGRYRARLKEIENESATLAELREQHEKREAALHKESERIQTALLRPDLVGVEEKFASISELLKQ